MRLSLLWVIVVAGCAGVPPSDTPPPLDSSETGAALFFEKAERPSEQHGWFTSVDGHYINGIPTAISIQPGNRAIGFICEIWVDGPPPPPPISMYFASGKSYLFQCIDGRHATVNEK